MQPRAHPKTTRSQLVIISLGAALIISISVWRSCGHAGSPANPTGRPDVVPVDCLVNSDDGPAVVAGAMEFRLKKGMQLVAAGDIKDGRCVPETFWDGGTVTGLPKDTFRVYVSVSNKGTWEVDDAFVVAGAMTRRVFVVPFKGTRQNR